MMPGEVISGHQKYEKKCDNCHESFNRKSQTRQCRTCHEKIDRDIKQKKGYHGRIKKIKTIECKVCHTDHKGRDADIVKMNKQTFDHKLTDFTLKGKHQSIACRSCHKSGELYRQAPVKCFDCHRDNDTHRGSLGKKCQQCHSQKSWQQARFDHDKTDFHLSGKHKTTGCGDCHISQNYKKTPKLCSQCHASVDIHAGSFGSRCEKCHRSDKWTKIRFNHDKKTDFKLTGKHKQTECNACHKKNPYKNKTPTVCYSCHKNDDAHDKVFGRKCGDCHNEQGWSQSKFKHNRDSSFKLHNKHAKTDCATCHQKNPYQLKSDRNCYACHRSNDIHNGSQGKQCSSCHNDNSWTGKVKFDHDLSNFPLIGLHATVTCNECHSGGEFNKAPSKCNECHANSDVHKGVLGKECQQCHNPNAWQRWTFDHDQQTDYKLAGAHHDIECHACHNPGSKIDDVSGLCIDCHANDDIHNGGFGNDCNRCHQQDSFTNIQIRN